MMREMLRPFYEKGTFVEFINSIPYLKSKNVLALSNRAMTYLKLGQFEAAVQDATQALGLDPCHVKSLQRRASAYVKQGMDHAALRDMEKALGYHPDSKELRAEKKRLQQKLRTLAPIEVLSSSSSPSGNDEEEVKNE